MAMSAGLCMSCPKCGGGVFAEPEAEPDGAGTAPADDVADMYYMYYICPFHECGWVPVPRGGVGWGVKHAAVLQALHCALSGSVGECPCRHASPEQ